MNNLENMNRIEEINKKLEELYKLEEEKKKICRKCDHNIIVVKEIHNYYSLDAECLFCGTDFSSSRELYGTGTPIEICDYIGLDSDGGIDAVRNLYREIIAENPNMENKKIAQKIKEKLDEKYFTYTKWGEMRENMKKDDT